MINKVLNSSPFWAMSTCPTPEIPPAKNHHLQRLPGFIVHPISPCSTSSIPPSPRPSPNRGTAPEEVLGDRLGGTTRGTGTVDGALALGEAPGASGPSENLGVCGSGGGAVAPRKTRRLDEGALVTREIARFGQETGAWFRRLRVWCLFFPRR